MFPKHLHGAIYYHKPGAKDQEDDLRVAKAGWLVANTVQRVVKISLTCSSFHLEMCVGASQAFTL